MVKFKKSVADNRSEGVKEQWIQQLAVCCNIENLFEAPYLNRRAI